MLCQVAPTPATSMVDKSLLAAVKTEMTLFESRGSQGALFAVNLKLLNVDTTSFCGEQMSVLRRGGFLHENTLSPQRSHDQYFMFSPLILPGTAAC